MIEEKNETIWRKIVKSNGFMYMCIALIAIICFCGIYGINVLNPAYVDWLMAGGDLSQHYLGWVAYRVSNWHFPVGMVDTLAYPYRTSIVFTDSIPIFALIFKMLSPVLPEHFQYFGLWGVCCFILQGICAARIIGQKNNKIVTVLGSSLFLVTPIMIWRMYMHTSLAGQWIILYALDMVFNPDRYRNIRKNYLTIIIVGFLSVSTHLYFVPMTGMVLIGYLMICLLKDKHIKRCFFSLLVYFASVATTVWLWGGFSSGMSAGAGGLEMFSFNLNNFVNPQGWSKIFKDLALYGGGQYEGFAYIGAGVILLAVLAIYACLNCGTKSEAVLANNKIQIIAIACVFLMSTLFALSPVISLGDKAVTLSFPHIVTKIWSVFRSTGRMVWVAVYLVMLLALISFVKMSKVKVASVVLIFSILLQVYDISDVLAQKNAQFKDRVEYQTLLATTDFWDTLADDKKIEHIVYYSSIDQGLMYSITKWALENGKTVNDFYFARSIGNLVNENREAILKELPDDTIYIFSTQDQMACIQYDLHYYQIDGLFVGSLNKIDGYLGVDDSDF